MHILLGILLNTAIRHIVHGSYTYHKTQGHWMHISFLAAGHILQYSHWTHSSLITAIHSVRDRT